MTTRGKLRIAQTSFSWSNLKTKTENISRICSAETKTETFLKSALKTHSGNNTKSSLINICCWPVEWKCKWPPFTSINSKRELFNEKKGPTVVWGSSFTSILNMNNVKILIMIFLNFFNHLDSTNALCVFLLNSCMGGDQHRAQWNNTCRLKRASRANHW